MPGPAGPSAPSGRVGMAAGSSHRSKASRARMTSLFAGVVALDVAGRIRLRVAEPLGLGERGVVVERRRLVGHRGQDEVGRAVDDAPDALDPVGGEVARRAGRGSGCRHRPPPRTAASHRSAGRSPRAPVRGARRRACSRSRRSCPSTARRRSACAPARRRPSARR